MEENNESLLDDEIIEMDESDFGDKPIDEAETKDSVVEDKQVQQTNEQNVENSTNSEDEAKKVIDYLNSQNMKFNGENVTIKDIEELKTIYQKGLNYDKVKAKADQVENDPVKNYINSKAQKMNLTAEEYINQVMKYEEDKEVESLMNKGVDEETARRVVKAEALKKDYDSQEAERKAKEDKDREYEDFIKAYPEIKASDIPQEVFINAQQLNIPLISAYEKYENKLLKEKIKQMEQNITNASSSPVKLTSNDSSTNQEPKDAFLEGFDSEF